MLYAIIAVLVILADQLIKLTVSAPDFHAMNLIPGVLNLTKVENTGGAFGLFGGQVPTYWFIIVAGVFTVLVILALATRFINGFLARWSIVLVTAGGVSNCIDRVINSLPEGKGHVVDMFQFDFWKSFPVFNLADVFITVFCIVFILAILFGRNPKEDEEYEDEFVEDAEEDLVEEEEEEKRPRRGHKARKADLEEEPEEEEDLRPAKASRKERKARQSKYDEEYEQYKAQQRAMEEARRAQTQTETPAPAAAPAQPAAVVENPAYDPADPFAEWERANSAQKPAAPAQPAPRAARRSELDADPQFAARPTPVQTVQQPAQAQPVEAVEPAPKPAPRPRRPAPKPVEEDTSFSLDDILAEFK